MYTVCNACTQGPVDIAGHPDLMVQSLGHGLQSFKCRSCQSLWLRKNLPTGAYAWEAIDDRQFRHPGLAVLVPTFQKPTITR